MADLSYNEFRSLHKGTPQGETSELWKKYKAGEYQPDADNDGIHDSVDDDVSLSMEEEFASQNKIAEMVDEEHPELLQDTADAPIEIPDEAIDSLLDLQVPDVIREAHSLWRDPDSDGTWQTFVKAAGGPVKAKKYRTMIEE